MQFVGTNMKYFLTKVSNFADNKLENTTIKWNTNFNQPSYELFLRYWITFFELVHVFFTSKHEILHRTTPCDNSKPRDLNFKICSSLGLA